MTDTWYLPRDPDELGKEPWLHPDAVAFFESILKPEFKVVEHGAGGSTLWLAERVHYVLTIEHNPEWIEKVEKEAPIWVVVVSELPLDILPKCDLFFIDGERIERGKCLTLASQFVKPGGWVVLDNANRPEYANERFGLIGQGFTLKARFANNVMLKTGGYSKYFVTEFWQRKA